MVESLEITKDKPIAITVLRNGERKTFTIQPKLEDRRYRIGVGSLQTKVITLPFAEAFKLSLHENRKNGLLILELVKKDGRAQNVSALDRRTDSDWPGRR